MGKAILSLLFVLLLFIDPLCHAQTSVKVSDPRIEMKGNVIHIYFDILNSSPDEKYFISVDIKDEAGNPINPHALDGDIGVIEDGAGTKEITWNLKGDHVFLDAYIFVQINAKIIPSPKPVVKEPEETPVHEEQVDETAAPSEEFNRAGIILQSLAFPGLGLSRLTGKPHWLRGVAGYGCIAGSVLMNRLAIHTFNEIEDLVYFDEINETYDKSLQQDQLSGIFFYTAIGIWVSDIVWTLVGTSDLKMRTYSGASRGFSFGSNIDPVAIVPMVSVRYRF
jgi:hypothetical protein